MSKGQIYLYAYLTKDEVLCKVSKIYNRNEKWLLIIEVYKHKVAIIEEKLKEHFTSLGYNYLLDSKENVYKKDIIEAVKPFLKSLKVKCIIYRNTSKL